MKAATYSRLERTCRKQSEWSTGRCDWRSGETLYERRGGREAMRVPLDQSAEPSAAGRSDEVAGDRRDDTYAFTAFSDSSSSLD